MQPQGDDDPLGLFNELGGDLDPTYGDILQQDYNFQLFAQLEDFPVENEQPTPPPPLVPPHPSFQAVMALPNPSGSGFRIGMVANNNNNDSNKQQFNQSIDSSECVVKNEADQSQSHLQQPKAVLQLSLKSFPGIFNFTASVKPLVNSKTKWCVSPLTNKLFVGKDITFPIRVSVTNWVNAEIVICPVFTESHHHMSSVDRCLNCANKDPDKDLQYHIVRVEGSDPHYFTQGDRCMVAVPLGFPAPGDDAVTFFVKSSCRTSCVGGPNRRLFSLVLTLLYRGREEGRQIVPIKVCESAERDMKNEDRNLLAQQQQQQQQQHSQPKRPFSQIENEAKIKIEQVSSSLCPSNFKKRKQEMESPSYRMMKVDVRFWKEVKKYYRFLRTDYKLNSSEDSESC